MSRHGPVDACATLVLASVDSIAKHAGKRDETGSGRLELPGPLQRDSRHHPQRLFRCAEANQALDEEGPAYQCEHERYPRPYVMKPDDDPSEWQVQKPVHEGARWPLAAEEHEEIHPGLGLHDVRESDDSEENDGNNLNRSLHPLLRFLPTMR